MRIKDNEDIIIFSIHIYFAWDIFQKLIYSTTKNLDAYMNTISW